MDNKNKNFYVSGLKSEVHNLGTKFYPTFEQKVITSESDPHSYEVILAVTSKAQKAF